ncbi:MAG TPA: hypothetical protein VFW83_00680 [Bryobacteraceae bacterium]|nr:hypothetical protein [Bryobacteraceae bacterium]
MAFSIWENKLSNDGEGDGADTLAHVNRLGNCALLEKNFNISKSNKGLKDFLTQIHEVVQGKIRIDAWCAALSISQTMLDPANATTTGIIDAIENRDKEIRAELIEFVRGQRVRVDLVTHPATSMNESPQSGPAYPVAKTELSQVLAKTRSALVDVALDGGNGATTETGTGADLPGLRAAYGEDPAVRLILDHFASRQNNQSVTKIDALVDALDRAGTASDKTALIHAFRRLDALGVGRFVPGRRGRTTRFEWREKSLTVRGLASNEAQHQSA